MFVWEQNSSQIPNNHVTLDINSINQTGLTIKNTYGHFPGKVSKSKNNTIQDLQTYKNYNIYSILKQHITYLIDYKTILIFLFTLRIPWFYECQHLPKKPSLLPPGARHTPLVRRPQRRPSPKVSSSSIHPSIRNLSENVLELFINHF